MDTTIILAACGESGWVWGRGVVIFKCAYDDDFVESLLSSFHFRVRLHFFMHKVFQYITRPKPFYFQCIPHSQPTFACD